MKLVAKYFINKRVYQQVYMPLGLLVLIAAAGYKYTEIEKAPAQRNPAMVKFEDSDLDTLFYNANGSFSPAKLAEFLNITVKKKRELEGLIRNYESSKGENEEQINKEISKTDEINYLQVLIDEGQIIQAFHHTFANHELREKLGILADIDTAVRVEGRMPSFFKQINMFRRGLKKWSVSTQDAPEKQATNLFDNSKNLRINPHTSNGVDLSKYNPKSMVSMWHDNAIEKTSVRAVYEEGQNPLYSDLKVEWPAQGAFILDSVRKSQTKPKLNVYVLDEKGKKKKYRLKLGREIHAEITTAALSSTLGFYNDMSKFYTRPKVYLTEMDLETFKNEWHSYYNNDEINDYLVKDPISGQVLQKDAKGQHFVVFKTGLIENRIGGIERMGHWTYWQKHHEEMRETRALLAFNLWVANSDLKTRDNNQFVMKQPKGSTQRSYFAMQHDVGFSMGSTFFAEAVENLEWELTKSKPSDRDIDFNFSSFQNTSGMELLTFADLKWTTRRIARLSRAQITEAVALGAWPTPVQKLLVEKLIARRNQMVKAVGLDQEGVKEISFDRKITTYDGSVVNGTLVKTQFEEYPFRFKGGFPEINHYVLRHIGVAMKRAMQNSISAVSKFSIDPVALNLDPTKVARVIVQIKRDSERNQNPKKDEEAYIVRDIFKIGFELQTGMIVGGRGQVTQEYQYIYTVKTPHDIANRRNFFTNLLLPNEFRDEEVPPNHIFVTELAFEGGGYFKSNQVQTLFPIGLQVNASRVPLYRSVLSTRNAKVLRFYEDDSYSNELSAKLFFDLAFLEIPFVKAVAKRGKIHRQVFEVPYRGLTQDLETYSDVKHALLSGDFSQIKAPITARNISSEFRERSAKFTLLGFWNGARFIREDQIAHRKMGDGLDKTRYQIQISDTRSGSWKIFSSSEEYSAKLLLVSKASKDPNVILDPNLYVTFFVDDNNTKAKELRNDYIHLINGGSNMQLVNFTPELHTVNSRFGGLVSNVSFAFGPRALSILLSEAQLPGSKIDQLLKPHGSDGNKVAKLIQKARAEPKGLDKYNFLRQAIVASTKKQGGIYDAAIMGKLFRAIGEIDKGRDLYVNGVIVNDPFSERTLPADLVISGKWGNPPPAIDPLYLYTEMSPLEMYEHY